ncbi:MAG: carboxypeptidase regulatory-like domain-containing protein [Planctomycetota bacterium]|jgi:hypothetical protein
MVSNGKPRRRLLFLAALGLVLLWVVSWLVWPPADDRSDEPQGSATRQDLPASKPAQPVSDDSRRVLEPELPADSRRPPAPTQLGDLSLFGTVIDERTLAPIPRFRVFCLPTARGDIRDYARRRPDHQLTRQRAPGDFRTPSLRPGTYNILVRARGYEDYVREGLPIPSAGSLAVVMSRGAHVEGRVTNPGGQALSQIPVILIPKKYAGDRRLSEIPRQQTDADGRFLFAALPAGVYTLSVATGGSTETGSFALAAGQRVERNVVVPDTNTIRFQIRQMLGHAVSGAEIRLYLGNSMRTAVTKDDGTAELRGIASGEYNVRVACKGFREHHGKVVVQGVGLEQFPIPMKPMPGRDSRR